VGVPNGRHMILASWSTRPSSREYVLTLMMSYVEDATERRSLIRTELCDPTTITLTPDLVNWSAMADASRSLRDRRS